MKSSLLSAIACALLATANLSHADSYELDTVHTQILFTVSHAGFSHSTGTFVDFAGGFEFDENDVAGSSAEVTIQTASLDYNDDEWNEHMRDENWFNVAEHPTITFKSTSVTETGEGTMDVAGDLTLLGVTKPVTLAVKLNKVGEMMGTEKAGFSATTTLNRTDFGMDAYVPMIGAEVEIRIEVEGVKG